MIEIMELIHYKFALVLAGLLLVMLGYIHIRDMILVRRKIRGGNADIMFVWLTPYEDTRRDGICITVPINNVYNREYFNYDFCAKLDEALALKSLNPKTKILIFRQKDSDDANITIKCCGVESSQWIKCYDKYSIAEKIRKEIKWMIKDAIEKEALAAIEKKKTQKIEAKRNKKEIIYLKYKIAKGIDVEESNKRIAILNNTTPIGEKNETNHQD